jgi:hypothetical protein
MLVLLEMSVRVIEATHATLESVMRRVPRKGAKATLALSMLSRIDWIVRQCGSLVLRAQCLASARGQCVGGRDARLCDARCASVMVVERLGELLVYRRTRNPLVVRLSPEGLTISRKGSVITVTGARVKVELSGGDGGRLEKVVRLDEVEDLVENIHLIRESLRGVEVQLSNTLRNLANCAKLTATPCP